MPTVNSVDIAEALSNPEVTPQMVADKLQEKGYSWPQDLSNFPKAMQDYLQGQQVSGIRRVVGLPLSEAAAGAANVLDLVDYGSNALTQGVVNPLLGTHFRNLPTQTEELTKLGLINTPSLIPQTTLEQIGAGAARGVGGAAAFLPGSAAPVPLLVSGAVGGALGEGSKLALGSDAAATGMLPLALPAAAGMLAAPIAGAVKDLPAAIAAARGPNAGEVYNQIAAEIGSPNVSMMQAGRGIQDQLFNMGRPGYIQHTNLPPKFVNKLMGMSGSNVANELLKDKNDRLLQIARADMPDQVDDLAGALVNYSAPKIPRLTQEARDSLYSPEHQQLINDTLAASRAGTSPLATTPSVGGELTKALLKTSIAAGLGAGAAHLAGFPGSEYLGGLVGESIYTVGRMAREHAANNAAAAIIGPWFRNTVGGAAVGGFAAAPPY